MALSFGEYQNTQHFAGLDGLRSVAIIAVIWHHTVQSGWVPALNRGYLGVDLFFVLSGFLITTLLLREKSRHGRISLKQFWARRFLRLMPAYYGLLVILVLAYGLLKPDDPNTKTLIDGLPIYALYLSNWFNPGANNLDPLWSLATEEQFYLIWPLIEAFFAPIFILIAGLSALIVNQLINFGILDSAIASTFQISPSGHPEILQSTFTPILLGVGVAHILHRKAWYARAMTVLQHTYAPIFYALALILVLNIPASDISGSLRLAMHGLMALFLASIVVTPGSTITKIFDIKALAFIGTISYGMYLFHMWCVFAISKILDKLNLDSPLILFAGTVVGTIMIAWISYRFYEQPFLKLRHRFRPKQPTSASPSPRG